MSNPALCPIFHRCFKRRHYIITNRYAEIENMCERDYKKCYQIKIKIQRELDLDFDDGEESREDYEFPYPS